MPQRRHILITRRKFLQLSGALYAVTVGVWTKVSMASHLHQSTPMLRGYGVGEYNQGSYPSPLNTTYLPLIGKEQQ